MIVSLVRESRPGERRVLLLPEDATQLTELCQLWVETGAGEGLGIADQAYQDIGARVVEREMAWKAADLLVKLKAPSIEELSRMRPGSAIAALFHAEGTPEIVEELVNRRLRAYSFEYFMDSNGLFPLMTATGEIAGKMAIIYAAYHLQSHIGGSGVALPALSHVVGARVAIIGYGNVGKAAAEVATLLGADVTVYTWRRDPSSADFSGVATRSLDDPAIRGCLADADVIVGALRVSTYDTPPIVTAEVVRQMRPGSVIVDVTAGFDAGYIETSDQLTSLSAPYRTINGVKHIKIRELPLGVHKSAAIQISRIYGPYVYLLAKSLNSHSEDQVVKRGKIVAHGRILNDNVEKHYLSGFRE